MSFVEGPKFGVPHHGGMPTAEELAWRQSVERAEYVARYGEPEVLGTNKTPEAPKTVSAMPSRGTIIGFRKPEMSMAAYVRMTGRSGDKWHI